MVVSCLSLKHHLTLGSDLSNQLLCSPFHFSSLFGMSVEEKTLKK